MCPKQGLGSCYKYITSSKITTRLHSTFPRRNGYSRLRQQESRRKESLYVDSGASMHMVSEKDLNSAELETMRTSRSPTTVMTANGEVRTNKERDGICQTIGLIRQCYVSSRNSRSAFIGETLWRTWVHLPLEKRSKTTFLIKNGKRIECRYIELWYHFVVPGISASSSSTTPSSASSTIFSTGVNIGWQWVSTDKQKCGNSSTRKKWKYEWRLRKTRCMIPKTEK